MIKLHHFSFCLVLGISSVAVAVGLPSLNQKAPADQGVLGQPQFDSGMSNYQAEKSPMAIRDFPMELPAQLVAAAHNDATGEKQYHLAQLYRGGTSLIQFDPLKSDAWLSEAEEKGYGEALFERGMQLKDHYDFLSQEEAVSLFARAAKQGHANAQYELASAYFNGVVLDQDFDAAHYWFAKASEKGVTEATFALGVMHQLGKGVPMSADVAMNYFKAASEDNHAMSQYLLGMGYYTGVGVDRNFSAAKSLFHRSMMGGNPEAAKVLQSIGIT